MLIEALDDVIPQHTFLFLILRNGENWLASFIAVVTAVLVVNGAKLAIPELVNWLAPSVIITPLIIYMARSYKKTK